MRFPRNGVPFAAAVGAVALASCSGGGGAPSVTYSPAPNFPTPSASSTATQVAVTTSSSPTNGTSSAPTGGASPTPAGTASATPSNGAGSTPTSGASATPTSTATTMPTTAATATATPTMTAVNPTPTATATATSGGGTSAAQCSAYAMMNASSSPPPTSSITEALPQNGGTIPLPAYEDSTGSSTTIAYTSSQQANVTITVGYTNDDGVAVPSGQTVVAFSSLILDQTATFAQQQSTVVTSVSPCNYVTGSTYYYTVYALGTTTQQTAQVDSFDPNAHTVTLHLTVPGVGPTYTFPANTKADIVISKTTP